MFIILNLNKHNLIVHIAWLNTKLSIYLIQKVKIILFIIKTVTIIIYSDLVEVFLKKNKLQSYINTDILIKTQLT